MIRGRPLPKRGCRRGAAAVTMLLLLVVTNLVVVGVVLRGAGDQDLTVHRLESVQSFYAAEAGVNMSIRELMRIEDEDGDGTIGSISDDQDEDNNPTVGGAAVVARCSFQNTTVEVESTGALGGSRRGIRADVALGERFEIDQVIVGGTLQTVSFQQGYHRPVVICTVQYSANTSPVIVSVSNVTRDGFDVRLKNPGNADPPVADTVFYMVLEQGVWAIDDATFEAQRYMSTVTDRSGQWNGQVQSYQQGYFNPVVLGQVMTSNDTLASVFWARGSAADEPPSTAELRTGKHVGQDTTTMRASEEIGFVIFERGHGALGQFEFDAQLTTETIAGVGDAPAYPGSFTASFAAPPLVQLASSAGMNDSDGGWPVVYGVGATATQLPLAIDEDQIVDAERNHWAEQVGILSFDSTGAHQGPTDRVVAWTQIQPD